MRRLLGAKIDKIEFRTSCLIKVSDRALALERLPSSKIKLILINNTPKACKDRDRMKADRLQSSRTLAQVQAVLTLAWAQAHSRSLCQTNSSWLQWLLFLNRISLLSLQKIITLPRTIHWIRLLKEGKLHNTSIKLIKRDHHITIRSHQFPLTAVAKICLLVPTRIKSLIQWIRGRSRRRKAISSTQSRVNKRLKTRWAAEALYSSMFRTPSRCSSSAKVEPLKNINQVDKYWTHNTRETFPWMEMWQQRT